MFFLFFLMIAEQVGAKAWLSLGPEQGEGKIFINGKTVDTKDVSVSDILASFGVHEGTHVIDRKSSRSLNPKASAEDIEKKPYYIFGSATTHTRKYYLLKAEASEAVQYKIIDDDTLEGAIEDLIGFIKAYGFADADKSILIRGLTFVYN